MTGRNSAAKFFKESTFKYLCHVYGGEIWRQRVKLNCKNLITEYFCLSMKIIKSKLLMMALHTQAILCSIPVALSETCWTARQKTLECNHPFLLSSQLLSLPATKGKRIHLKKETKTTSEKSVDPNKHPNTWCLTLVSIAWNVQEYYYITLPLDRMLVHHNLLPRILSTISWYPFNLYMYSLEERGTMTVKFLAQENNRMSPARAQTHTTKSRV